MPMSKLNHVLQIYVFILNAHPSFNPYQKCSTPASSSSSILSTEAEVSFITRRQLDGDLPPNFEKQPKLSFPNDRLKRAYIALHAWKLAFFSDPLQTTDNWVGPDVCSYSGVFCASALDDPNVEVVAGIAGCFPSAIANMPNLNEIVLKNNELAGCLPVDMSSMRNLTVLDISDNKFTGILPKTMSGLESAEAIDISNNMLTGFVPENVCRLPKLTDFAFSGNYFNGEARPACHPDQRKEIALDERDNCLPERPNQKSPEECKKVVGKLVECSKSLSGPPQPPVRSPPRPPVARPSPRPVQSQPPVRPLPPPVVPSPPQPPVVQSPTSIVESPPEDSSTGGEGSIYSNQLFGGSSASSGGSIFSSVGGDGSASASGSFSASANSHFSASANSGFSASASTTGTDSVSDRW